MRHSPLNAALAFNKEKQLGIGIMGSDYSILGWCFTCVQVS
ncbi:hypothetical protein ACWM6O_004230 [Vibrio vulnificus]